MLARRPVATACASTPMTSACSGSIGAPGSLVRSSTATLRTLAGSAARKASTGKGRYSRICMAPTFCLGSCAFSQAAVSRTTSAPEPMLTTTRSASSGPS